MFINIRNTGKISQAQIEIKGITVIAGVNNTGKSTVGKVLFCLFNSFYNIDQQIEQERKFLVSGIIEKHFFRNMGRLVSTLNVHSFAKYIISMKEAYVDNEELLTVDLRSLYIQSDKNYEKYLDDSSLSSLSDSILQILNVSNEEIFVTVFQRRLQAEFNMQINNIYQPDLCSEIVLKIKDTEFTVVIKENEIISITNNFSLNTEVIYMDDLLALEEPRHMTNAENHRDHLKSKLFIQHEGSIVQSAIDQIIAEKKLATVISKINNICGGEVIRQPNASIFTLAYQESDAETALDIRNISTGIKAFVILKTLLQNGSLEDNGIIVLDEPEIHLHPEWQLVFAELIILLQKEFNMHVLLNTHSPYFLEAIDVFSHKYGIADKCKYYLAENAGRTAIINDVSDNLEKIYDKLSRPLQVLENERYQDA